MRLGFRIRWHPALKILHEILRLQDGQAVATGALKELEAARLGIFASRPRELSASVALS